MYFLASVWVYECVCAHRQPLEQELMNLHDFSPAACGALWGFSQALSLLSLALSLPLWHSVRGGCPRLLPEERRVNSHTLCPYTHTQTHTHTMQKKPRDDDCRGFGCHGNSPPPPPFAVVVRTEYSDKILIKSQTRKCFTC